MGRGPGTELEPRPERRNATSSMSAILLQVIVSGLLLGAVYALFSSGLTLIWGMMNVVNFAHGDFVMLAMYTAFVVWTVLGGGPAAAVPVAAMVLATLGVLSYFLLVRHIMKGPMLAQILGTFGLALLLRYSAFWYFGANFKTLPDNIVGPPFVFGGIRVEAPRLLAGTVGLLVTLAAASDPDAHGARQPHAGRVGGRHGRAAHGHPARAHAGARLGARRRLDRHCRRADRHLLLHLADRGRDARRSSPSSRWRSAASAACRARWSRAS